MGFAWIAWFAVATGAASGLDLPAASENDSVARSVAYLSQEVPRWATESKCYSCHNNGDAARALYFATRNGVSVDAKALTSTTGWLSQPDQWEHNRVEGGPERHRQEKPEQIARGDRTLATIQFASALSEATKAGLVNDKDSLLQAAELLLGIQETDGSWPVDTGGQVGSPVTYGQVLSTAMVLDVLDTADRERFAPAIERGRTWLRNRQPKSLVDAAAVLVGLASCADESAQSQRQTALDLIRQGQHASGGWGPFVRSQPEPFDTALVLWALSEAAVNDNSQRIEARIVERGREYLVACQLADGSWPETTRPAGGESYAHRVSTTAWATLALVRTTTNNASDPDEHR